MDVKHSASSFKRSYAGLTMDERRADRRERFIQAGARLFGTVGFRGTSVRNLCMEAGLNDRYFYEAFGSTEALLIEVLDALMIEFQRSLMAAISTSGVEVKSIARAGLRAYFEAVSDPVFARISLFEILGVSPAVDQAYTASTLGFARVIAGSIRATQAHIQLSPADEEVLGMALLGAVIAPAVSWVMQGYQQPIDLLVDNCMKVIVGTLTYLALPQD